MTDSKNPVIVLADDESFITTAYKEGFERAGFVVHVTDNGEDAVKMTKELKPDIVCLDLIMPKMNGFEALKAIKADPSLKDIPVAILSNLSQGTDEKEAKELGADDFVVKSDHSLIQVIERLNKLLGRTTNGGENVTN